MAQIKSKTEDYMRALEGATYGTKLIEHYANAVDDAVMELNRPGMMDGETAKKYLADIKSAANTLHSIVSKLRSFSDKAIEVCNANHAFLEDEALEDFNAISSKFNSIAEYVKTNKIQTK